MTFLLGRPVNRLIVAGAIIIGCSLVGHAHTHHDADGSTVDWYPQECCGDGDCQPVATLRSAPQGLWLTTVDGQTVLIGPRDQRRPSGDARWHVCLVAGERDYPPHVACIFGALPDQRGTAAIRRSFWPSRNRRQQIKPCCFPSALAMT